MKYLKSFFEADAWAGSLLAYDKRIVSREDKVIPDSKKIEYRCDNCHFEFYVYNKEVENCSVCGSKNISKSLI